MEQMKKIAGRLDVCVHVFKIMFTVAAVAALVGLLLIGACFAFDMNPEMIGTGYESLDLDFMELELAAEFAPEKHVVLAITAAELVMAVAAALLAGSGMGSVRRLLAPMKEGLPFQDAASSSLKRLALLSLILGAVLNLSELIKHLLIHRFYNLPGLLVGEKILSAQFQFDLDFSCLVISAVLLLLSYVFRYGQTLQQLSDETL